MKKFWKNKTIITPILIAIIFIIGIIVVLDNYLQGTQLKLTNNLYGQDGPSNKIVIVTIDDTTLDPQTGLGPFATWKRDNFAKVIDNINKYNPKAIGIDFFFKDAKDETTDDELATSLTNTQNPILIFYSDFAKNLHTDYENLILNTGSNGLPLKKFNDVPNTTTAFNKIMNSEDGIIRTIYPAATDTSTNKFYDSFALAIAKKALGINQQTQPENFNDSMFNIDSSRKIPLEDGKMNINFFKADGNGQEYQQVKFVTVYNETYNKTSFDPSLFKDKIVLIGATADSFKDSYVTPINSNFPMPGVQIHANAIQTILDNKFLRNETPLEKILVLFLLLAAGGYIFMYTKIRWSLLYVIGVPAAYAFAAPAIFRVGIIVDLIHPFLMLPAIFIACYMYRYFTEFSEKRAIQSAFGKYVNPALVKQITEHPESLKLGGENREITVMFTDIVNSTKMEEKLKPESIVALLKEYFQAMSDVIMSEGGTVDKFEGDGIMALFGAPISQPDHALRATRAALNMRVKLAQLLEKWKTDPPLPGGETKPQLDFRCGLSSGEAIVGNMGSSDRFDYTALGDIVNLGSRLESGNKKYETRIMMSQKTQEFIKDQFETRELDTIQVLGKTEPIKVFELLAPKGQLPQNVLTLLNQYNEAIAMYHGRKFAEALAKFEDILKTFPGDGPSKLYRQRCEVLRDFPPKPDWNGVFEMGSK